MDPGGATSEKPASREEAAGWLALLHSDDRTPGDEAAFRAWLAERPENQSAFDSVTTAWEVAGGLAAEYRIQDVLNPRRARLRRLAPLLAVGLVLLVAGLFVWLRPTPGEIYETGPRETRRIAAADGSVILLDASSRIRVRIGARNRDVVLERGRAHFDVPADLTRPLRVEAGNQSAFIVGGQMDVTQSGAETSILLITERAVIRTERPRSIDWGIDPGQRLTFDADGTLRRDRPDLAKLTAWESGRAVFRDDTIAAAAVELNRYSRRPLVIADPEVARLRVSGDFKAGATEDFAFAMVDTLHLGIRVEPDKVVLSAPR
jgi:transmembrane sensor